MTVVIECGWKETGGNHVAPGAVKRHYPEKVYRRRSAHRFRSAYAMNARPRPGYEPVNSGRPRLTGDQNRLAEQERGRLVSLFDSAHVLARSVRPLFSQPGIWQRRRPQSGRVVVFLNGHVRVEEPARHGGHRTHSYFYAGTRSTSAVRRSKREVRVV